MRVQEYDLIVIGGGPAGEKGAAQAAYFGKKVALIERGTALGGTVASTSIPFKALRESALYLEGFRTRKLQGIDFNLKERATLRDFISQEHGLVRDFRFRIATNLDNHSVDVFPGQAAFVDSHTVKVEHLKRPPIFLSADVILIASGSRPYHPPQFDFSGDGDLRFRHVRAGELHAQETRHRRHRPDRLRIRLHPGVARLLGHPAGRQR
jgi:NAD(P) transhydrogenase